LADEVLDPSDPRVRGRVPESTLIKSSASVGSAPERLPRGTVLFEPGARRVDFFLVLDGFIEAYASRGTAQQVVHVYGEQQFTGELNLFNDRAILVGGRMGGDGRVARLNCSEFRRLLAAAPDIADVALRELTLLRSSLLLHARTATIIALAARAVCSCNCS
jgi:thioredoxin reductase (NADPH)